MAKAKKTVKKKSAAKPAQKKTPAKKPAMKAATKKSAAKKASAKPRKTAPKSGAKKTTAKTPKPAALQATKTPTPSAPKAAMKDYSNFVTPLDDRVLVRMKDLERKTAGGLFIPDTVADVSGNLQGSVVAVGRGHRDKKGRVRPMDIQLGDRIVFDQYAGSKINILGEDLLLLREGEVMGIIS